MASLVHEIERRVHGLGGSDVVIRCSGSGSGKILISFIQNGEPRSALMTMPARRARGWMRLNAKDAIAKAIR